MGEHKTIPADSPLRRKKRAAYEASKLVHQETRTFKGIRHAEALKEKRMLDRMRLTRVVDGL